MLKTLSVVTLLLAPCAVLSQQIISLEMKREVIPKMSEAESVNTQGRLLALSKTGVEIKFIVDNVQLETQDDIRYTSDFVFGDKEGVSTAKLVYDTATDWTIVTSKTCVGCTNKVYDGTKTGKKDEDTQPYLLTVILKLW